VSILHFSQKMLVASAKITTFAPKFTLFINYFIY